MRDALISALPTIETSARTAKSSAAKKKLRTQVQQIREALDAAEKALPLARDSA